MSSTGPDAAPEARRRLFLALWPDAHVRQAMAAIAGKASGGRVVRPANLHLTLVFLGATDAHCLACYERALDGLVVPLITLRLERLGCWPRRRILWLAPAETPAELVDLVAQINARLASCGFTPESRPFRAHITLSRKYARPRPRPIEFDPPVWVTRRVVLVESSSTPRGVRYAPLRCWGEAG